MARVLRGKSVDSTPPRIRRYCRHEYSNLLQVFPGFQDPSVLVRGLLRIPDLESPHYDIEVDLGKRVPIPAHAIFAD
jgi:hypothetical protein